MLSFNSDAKKERTSHTAADSSDSQEKVGPFASFRIRNFRLLITGTILSNAAQWIQQVTLSWLVYELTGSGTMLGSINMVRTVATLGLVPIAGVLIDRINRRILMLMTNGWLFIISLVLGLILILGRAHISHLFIFTFLGGMSQAIDMSLRQVVIFDLVPRSFAPNAVALIQTGWALMRSLGPAIGGFIILWIGPGGNFLVQAGAYALIAITIVQIQFPSRKLEGGRSFPLQNIREGIRYAVKQRMTRTFMMIGWILPLLIIPNFVALPAIYAKDIFHGGPDVLGYLLSSVGVGGFLGGVFTASLGRMERRGVLQLISLFILSLSLIFFALSTELWTALPILVCAGFFEMIFLTTNQTLLQLSIPDNLRGRVTSIVNLNAALSPLGCFVAGAGSDLLGGPGLVTIILSGTAACLAVCILLFSPTVRNYRLSKAITEESVSKAAS